MIKKLLLCLMALTLCASCAQDDKKWTEKMLIIDHQLNQKGVLVLPKKIKRNFAVVLLSGSGPNDADYTIDGIGLYQELAEALAEAGIVSFRMEKRSRYIDEITTIQQEILEDAQLVIDLLSQSYEKVIVLGHSLSAMVLPALKADGMIMLSGSVSELEEIYANQLMKHADEAQRKQIQEELTMIQNLQEDTGFSWFGIKESYWISLDKLDLAEKRQDLDVPVLVIHGSEDDVIDASEFEKMKMILKDKNATCILMNGLDHYLRADGSLHLEQSVILEIVSWILNFS